MIPVRYVDGQRFTALVAIPHICRDGRETVLLRWWSLCANCGRPFSCTLPAKAKKFAPNRRCQRCKRPGQRVRRATV